MGNRRLQTHNVGKGRRKVNAGPVPVRYNQGSGHLQCVLNPSRPVKVGRDTQKNTGIHKYASSLESPKKNTSKGTSVKPTVMLPKTSQIMSRVSGTNKTTQDFGATGLVKAR